MGYLYLTLALAGGLLKGFSGKKVSGGVESFGDCVLINLLRLLFSAVIGFFFLIPQLPAGGLLPDAASLGVYLFSAVGMVCFCVSYMFAYRVSAYMFLSIFGMLGSVVTTLLGALIYAEPIGWNKWVGIVILLIAVAIMSRYNKDIRHQVKPRDFLILLIACLSVALSDFSQKIYVHEIGGDAAVFNFYTYALGTLVLAVMLVFTRKQIPLPRVKLLYSRRNILLCVLIASGLFLNTYSKTLAAAYLSSAEIYPVLQGSNLIASALLAHVLLGEKINRKSVIGMSCAFAGLLVMHML